jgi:hypothetical protein
MLPITAPHFLSYDIAHPGLVEYRGVAPPHFHTIYTYTLIAVAKGLHLLQHSCPQTQRVSGTTLT